LGSNLTESGHVEADAAMMDGKTVAFGSVAAARGSSSSSRMLLGAS